MPEAKQEPGLSPSRGCSVSVEQFESPKAMVSLNALIPSFSAVWSDPLKLASRGRSEQKLINEVVSHRICVKHYQKKNLWKWGK